MRLLVYAVLIAIVYFVAKKYAKTYFASSKTDEACENHSVDTEMVQDPHCGAYFLKQRGVKGVVEGKVVHFCSEECYDKYLKRRSRS